MIQFLLLCVCFSIALFPSFRAPWGRFLCQLVVPELIKCYSTFYRKREIVKDNCVLQKVRITTKNATKKKIYCWLLCRNPTLKTFFQHKTHSSRQAEGRTCIWLWLRWCDWPSCWRTWSWGCWGCCRLWRPWPRRNATGGNIAEAPACEDTLQSKFRHMLRLTHL